GERGREGADAEPCAVRGRRVGELRAGEVESLGDGVGMLEQDRAFLREPEAAGLANQQPDADLALQRRDLIRHGGLGEGQLACGVFQIDPADTAQAVTTALDAGYRHIDTAEMYGNERGVGEAVRASGLDRADVFITSKLSNAYHPPDDARRAFDRTLVELGLD